MTGYPRLTFGTIVLNGEPFVRYHLRALYPHAHELIVVEGAVLGAAALARPDGHSRDGTLDTLRRFKKEEDPQDKLTIVTAEDEGHPDGFWRGEKDEQSRAYALRATGDYLWQVDIDEFYTDDGIRRVADMLRSDRGITAVSFPMLTFWSSPRFCVDGWYLMRGGGEYHRLFRWGPGFEYATHRPPTVLDEQGRDTRCVHWRRARDMARRGVLLYHYSLLFPMQVREKVEYYSTGFPSADRFRELQAWYERSYRTLRRPYRVHNVYQDPSWLALFSGRHPAQFEALWMDTVKSGTMELRPTRDAERLLATRWYPLGGRFLLLWEPVDRGVRAGGWRIRRGAGRVVKPLVRTLQDRRTAGAVSSDDRGRIGSAARH